MTLSTALRRGRAFTRRIVATTVVSERSLSYAEQSADCPEKLYDFWQRVVATEPDHEPDKECVVAIALNTRMVPIAWNRVSLGTLNESPSHPREIFRPMIAANCHGFVLMHNHPSGDPSPSGADDRITRRIRDGAEILQIRFHDHVIVGKPAPGRTPYWSFREAGILC